MLTKLVDTSSLVRDYAQWLLYLREMNLLEVFALKPLVNGKQLMHATGRTAGPWLVSALNMAMEWQLRNPESTDTEAAIAEVLTKFGTNEK